MSDQNLKTRPTPRSRGRNPHSPAHRAGTRGGAQCLGDTGLRYLALLLQDIPRSCKLDSQLNYVDVALGRLELAAVQVGEQVGAGTGPGRAGTAGA